MSFRRSPLVALLAVFMAVSIAVPPQAWAQAQQRAGEVSRVVQKASIQRGSQQIAAAAQAPVLWQDVIATDRGGRARVALDDGSVLNVGSESSLTITQHDASSQQTELELTYGRVRANVVRMGRPASKFQVKTPTAVAGVVGTDFFLSFINGITQLIVYDGIVQFCNLAGVCVTVGAGQTSSVRGNESPQTPVSVPPSQSMEAGKSTQVAEGAAAGAAAGGLSVLAVVIAVVAVVVPIVIVTAANRDDGSSRNPRCCPSGVP
jgi:hypothetical protein